MDKLVSLLISFLLLISVSLMGSDYPQWRGANRDGVALGENLANKWDGQPAEVWSIEGIGTGYSSPIEVKGKLYITGMKDGNAVLSAVEKESGKILWQSQYGQSWDKNQYGGERCTPTFDGGKLYVLNPQAQLYCFNAEDGVKVWSVDGEKEYGARNITWGITESVVIDGDKVIFTPGAEDAAVVALNKNDGSFIWKSQGFSKSAYCSPAVVSHNGSKMLVTLLEDVLLGLDINTGEILWQTKHKVAYGINAVTPVYYDGIVFVANGYKLGGKAFEIAADNKSVKEIWTEKKLDCHFGGISCKDGAVYGIGQKGNIYALDIKTGNVIAQSEPYVGKGALMMADDKLYCYGESGKVALVNYDGKSFSLGGIFEITKGEKEHWAHPVVANGTLYIRHGDFLMAFDASK